jgi:hypothetical protein
LPGVPEPSDDLPEGLRCDPLALRGAPGLPRDVAVQWRGLRKFWFRLPAGLRSVAELLRAVTERLRRAPDGLRAVPKVVRGRLRAGGASFRDSAVSI